jgi:hypothetical protein
MIGLGVGFMNHKSKKRKNDFIKILAYEENFVIVFMFNYSILLF